MRVQDARRTKRRLFAAYAAAAALVVAGCGGSPTAQGNQPGKNAGAENAKVYAELMKLSDDELVKRAQKEGELTLYTSMTSDIAEPVTEAFTDAYDIDVNLYRANSETVLQRIVQEQKAGFRGNDVVETNATEMLNLQSEGAMTPYTRPPVETVGDIGRFKTWTATRFNVFAPSWNTDRVKSGEEPTSWEDLADPKWKGQISMELGDYDWFLTLYGWFVKNGKSPEETEELFRAMARNAKVVKGHTVQAEMMSAGRFSIVASNYTYIVELLRRQGAPVGYEPLVEPVVVRPNGIGLMKTAEHPAAATLFTDWLLTDGQDVLIDQAIVPSVESKQKGFADVEQIPVDIDKLVKEDKKWSTLYDDILREGEEVKE